MNAFNKMIAGYTTVFQAQKELEAVFKSNDVAAIGEIVVAAKESLDGLPIQQKAAVCLGMSIGVGTVALATLVKENKRIKRETEMENYYSARRAQEKAQEKMEKEMEKIRKEEEIRRAKYAS